MLGTYDELKFVHATRRDTPLTRPQHVPSYDCDIDFAVTDALLHDPRVRNSESDANAWIRISKSGDKRRQHVGSRRRAGADYERSLLKAVQVGERLPARSERCDDARGVVGE